MKGSTSTRSVPRRCLAGSWPSADGVGAVAAIAALSVLAVSAHMESRRADESAEARASSPAGLARGVARPPELMIGAYGGTPYTYDSDVRFHRSAGPKRDFTVRDVEWEGQPFKHPVYYGVRVVRWGEGAFGGMVDFVHSKSISRMAQEVRLLGTLDGQPVPERARIGDLFDKLEFSHGHNMLMATGLVRLASLGPWLAPYVGAGAGVSLPHTEIHIEKSDPRRTYEYQFTGPALQALAGLEIRLARVSLFVEYKFTFARYSAPLTHGEGSWLPLDLMRQFGRWWSGAEPPGGFADTRLTSHQAIGGVGVRIGLSPATR